MDTEIKPANKDKVLKVYKITGKGVDTGRKRERYYEAFSEFEAIDRANADGTEVNDFQFIEQNYKHIEAMQWIKSFGIDISEDDFTAQEIEDFLNFVCIGEFGERIQVRDIALGEYFNVKPTSQYQKRQQFQINIFRASKGNIKSKSAFFIYEMALLNYPTCEFIFDNLNLSKAIEEFSSFEPAIYILKEGYSNSLSDHKETEAGKFAVNLIVKYDLINFKKGSAKTHPYNAPYWLIKADMVNAGNEQHMKNLEVITKAYDRKKFNDNKNSTNNENVIILIVLAFLIGLIFVTAILQ